MKAESQQSTFLWVDAICINQNDLTEQAIEVKRMGMIYSSAETVIVWIGAPRIESDAPNLRYILRRLDRTRQDIDPKLLDSEWPVWSDNNSSRMINQFFSKEWWQRTWVFQEIVLAKNIFLHYGTVSFTWDTVSSSQLHFYYLHSNCALPPGTIPEGVFKAMRRVLTINFVRDSRARGLKVRLTQLLCMDRRSFCSDPRDRIYGLLGLAEDRDVVSPDYTKPIRWVLQDVVQSLIKKGKSLNVICMLPKFHKMDGLPSWLPDFTASSPPRNFMSFLSKDPNTFHVFMASGTMPFSGVQVKAGVLSAKGIILDVVDGMGSATVVSRSTRPSLPSHENLQQSTTNNSRYPSKNDLFHAIWRTLVSSRTTHDTKATSASGAVYLTFKSVTIPKENWLLEDVWKWKELDEIRLFYANNAMLKVAGKSLSDWINLALPVFEPNLDASVKGVKNEIRYLPYHVKSTLRNQRFLVTASGYIGYVPNETKRGDTICILYGMDVPVVLRKNQDKTFEVIGPCYVHGVMEGELMNDLQNGVFEEIVFDIT
ncbi:uncharacterized protein EAE98_009420 [Botrytis deweyae]|uniref:Heterokaryon incompatibility domain-containing protein n=1 Tax=Botrytis deweyae TaxID=2478750 RepID=A0ABQ7IBN4_9HELO|nr:uncharacterized protein EAE98_009420 [Botrytis deweyae]KAF7919100.1 hypothetical protein EAE98_009420 [Botrytis deweyae]